MFPTLPAMLAALWLCEERPARAAGLDRPVPRRHGRHGVYRRLGLARPRGRRRPVRPALDRQGGALRLGGLHLAQGRLSVGRHGGLSAGRGRRRHSRHPGLGHLALYLDGAGWWRSRPWRCPCCGARRHDPRARALVAIFGVTFVDRRRLQPLFPAAGSADADQRHGLADGRLGTGAGGGPPALRRPRPGGPGRPDGGAVRLQCLEPGAAARAGQRLAAGDRARWSTRPIPRAPSG